MKPNRIAVAVAGVALIASACGSSSNAAPPKSTTTTSTSTSVPSATGLASLADQLCGQITTTLNDLGHLDLRSPSGLASVPGTVSSDFGRLQAAARNIQNAGAANGHAHQVQTVVGDVQEAIGAGNGAIKALAAGNLGTASNGLGQISTDLSNAQHAAATAKLGNCSSPAPTSSTTSPG